MPMPVSSIGQRLIRRSCASCSDGLSVMPSAKLSA
jgi:hypothetical protein